MRHLVLLISVFTIFYTNGQITLKSFDNSKHFDKQDGLKSHNINAINEDDSGFLWLATHEGIIRYDGYRFTQFNSYQGKTGQGKLNIVYSICIDRINNIIWTGGKNGLFYSSLDNIDFKLYPLWNELTRANYPAIRTLVLDKNNMMWVGGLNGIVSIDLNKQNYKNGEINSHYITDRFDILGINGIVLDNEDNETLWATGVGLYEINISTSEYNRYLYGDNSQNHENSIRSINQTSNNLILGTYSAGAILFDKKNKSYSRLKEEALNINDDIYSIKKTDLGYWFTTPKGIVVLDSTLSVTKGIKFNDFDSGQIYGLTFIDSRGISWYGFTRGLFSYDGRLDNTHFVSLESYSQLNRSLVITSIEPYNDDYFISGYSSKGIYKLNPNSKEADNISINIVKPDVDGLYNTSAVKRINNDSLLMVINDELVFFNLRSEQFSLSPLQIPAKDVSIKALEMEALGVYWVGDRRNGLFKVDFNTGIIENFNDKLILREGSMPWINELLIDSKNHLWIGKGSRSLISLEDMNSKSISPEKKIPFYQDVYKFYEDNTGRVWMAGGTDGMGYITSETVDEGVNHVMDGNYEGIFKRNDSTVWVLDEHLKIFNLNSLKIESTYSNSLKGFNEITGPVMQGEDIVVIGCHNGVILYRQPFKEVPSPGLFLQEISINGNTFYKGQSLTQKAFILPRNTRNLTAQIGFYGFDNPNTTYPQYQYRTSAQWIDLDPLGNINITNLGKGTYNLELRPIDNNTAEMIQFQFEIKPYWYNSQLAYLIYMLLFGASIYALYKFNLTRKLAIAESKNTKELIDYKSRMYTNITHEFRTPLTVILGLSDTIKSDLKEGNNNHAKEAANIIERNGKALLQLVNQLLGISKLESGTIEIKMLQADIIQFLRYIYESFKDYSEKSKINLVFYTEVDSLFMDFDDEKLQTVVSNLLSNALKFTPKKGQVVVHISTKKESKKDYLFIKIRDNGHGIPKKSIPFIFDRFYQVNHIHTKSDTGSGIGLAMSKELTELMDGTLIASSEINKGTTMTLKLPISNDCELLTKTYLQDLDGLETQKDKPNWSSTFFGDNSHLPHVLIIEDNADVIYYLKICLHGHYKVVVARDGQEGIEVALRDIPDIIISDIMMPKKDGFEVCETLKKDPRTDHIPIILLTAKSTKKDKIKGLSCGADAYLNKPFLKAEMLTRLDQLVLLRKRLVHSLTQSKYSQILNSENEKPEMKFLQKVINLVHDEIDNPDLGSSLLAKRLNMSESQIYRKVKAITGKSTAIFIRSVRLEKAKDLVQSSDKSISEIAYSVGFNDPSWFTRAFKKEYGRSPKSFQKS